MIKRNLLIRAHKCAYRNIGKKRKNNTDQTVHKGLPVVPFYNDANAVISHPVSVTDFVVKRLYDSQFGGILILTFYGGNICGAFKADFDAAFPKASLRLDRKHRAGIIPLFKQIEQQRFNQEHGFGYALLIDVSERHPLFQKLNRGLNAFFL